MERTKVTALKRVFRRSRVFLPVILDKAKFLRAGAGSHPIALASGISPENVSQYLPYVDAYLVASSIETEENSGIFVPERAKLLANMIHGYGLADNHLA